MEPPERVLSIANGKIVLHVGVVPSNLARPPRTALGHMQRSHRSSFGTALERVCPHSSVEALGVLPAAPLAMAQVAPAHLEAALSSVAPADRIGRRVRPVLALPPGVQGAEAAPLASKVLAR